MIHEVIEMWRHRCPRGYGPARGHDRHGGHRTISEVLRVMPDRFLVHPHLPREYHRIVGTLAIKDLLEPALTSTLEDEKIGALCAFC